MIQTVLLGKKKEGDRRKKRFFYFIICLKTKGSTLAARVECGWCVFCVEVD